MNFIAYPCHPDYQPGTWKGLALTDGGCSASFTCPRCENLAVLTGHHIDDSGKVSPSVVCPAEGCDFHEYIQLEGWRPLSPESPHPA